MKGYYLFAPMESGCAGQFSGIEKKIRGQCAAFSNHFDMRLLIFPLPEKRSRFAKITTRLPFFPVSNQTWKYTGEFNDADFLYIRQVRHDYRFIAYLREIKHQNPTIKIIYEIPTFPYDSESRVTFKNCHVMLKERWNRRKLKHYIDRVVTFYAQDFIFDIPTIRLKNGFDFSTLVPNDTPLKSDAIHIIEVATTAFWHGYDRFIQGMADYYQSGGSRSIVFHMVGEPLPELVELVTRNRLEDRVLFHGPLAGTELDEVYRVCSLAVDVLGGHRKNYPISSSLKSREYSAKGVPVITSSPIDFMEATYPYQLCVSYDDQPIDMNTVIDFYDSCYRDKDIEHIRNEIRMYAEERCDINRTLLPVVEYLKNDK